MKNIKEVFFSDFFQVDSRDLEKYGAYNISLIADTKMFIDPILLYASKDKTTREAHKKIIKYLAFLYHKSKLNLDYKDKQKWFTFKEPKQNWFGYTIYGSSGHGLNMDFANHLYEKLKKANFEFNDESHPEQIFFFGKGHGSDNISDFTVRLILDYLLEFTQAFTLEYIDENFREERTVEKCKFDYKLEEWIPQKYILPIYNNDFIILTPNKIIIEDDTYINLKDLLSSFTYYVEQLSEIDKEKVNAHLSEQLFYEVTTSKEKEEIMNSTIERYPIIIESYINEKVKNKQNAINRNLDLIKNEKEFQSDLKNCVNGLVTSTNFYNIGSNTLKKCILRSKELKKHIESNVELYSFLIKSDNKVAIKRIANIWYSGKTKEKTMKNDKIEFFISTRSPIENVIKNRFLYGVPEKAVCYFVTKKEDMDKLEIVLNKYGLVGKEELTAIKLY